jgi:hypothetical protein
MRGRGKPDPVKEAATKQMNLWMAKAKQELKVKSK